MNSFHHCFWIFFFLCHYVPISLTGKSFLCKTYTLKLFAMFQDLISSLKGLKCITMFLTLHFCLLQSSTKQFLLNTSIVQGGLRLSNPRPPLQPIRCCDFFLLIIIRVIPLYLILMFLQYSKSTTAYVSLFVNLITLMWTKHHL